MFQTKEVSFQVHHTAGQMGQAGQAAETENLLNRPSLPIASGSQKEILSANMLPGISTGGDVITIFMPKIEFRSQICSEMSSKMKLQL